MLDNEIMTPSLCPCGSTKTYAQCCAGAHRGVPVQTATELMASRYAAFALGNREYLVKSWHTKTRPADLELDPEQMWTRLRILGSTAGGPNDTHGTVHFRAHYRYGGERGYLEENSRFLREHGQWVYLDGEIY